MPPAYTTRLAHTERLQSRDSAPRLDTAAMKVVLFGATGMVGSGALLECLDSPRVKSVVAISRSVTGRAHPKLREIVHSNFFDLGTITAELSGADACFFCLGVSSAGMSEAEYTRLTHDLTLAAATALLAASPQLTFVYVSGAGTDSTAQGRTMWARVKGKTEDDLLAMPFKAAYMFRPGYIQPMRGVRSKTRLYQALYDAGGWLYPVLRTFIPRHVTTTVNMGRAMIEVAANGYPKPILDVADINAAAMIAGTRENGSQASIPVAHGASR
jgi:nucleoside-diphosphate-sugar epimerase